MNVGHGGASLLEHSYDVMQQGSLLKQFTNKRISLDVIDVKISYDNDNGDFEFTFVFNQVMNSR
jgi:hypothetical protein